MLARGSDTFSVLPSRKEMNLGAGSRTKLITQNENVFAQNEAAVFHSTAVGEGLVTGKTDTPSGTAGDAEVERSRDAFLDKVKNRRHELGTPPVIQHKTEWGEERDDFCLGG